VSRHDPWVSGRHEDPSVCPPCAAQPCGRVALGVSACGEDDVERNVNQGAEQAEDAGSELEKAGEDAAREAEKAAEDAQDELEK
jgi:hypothetical protein